MTGKEWERDKRAERQLETSLNRPVAALLFITTIAFSAALFLQGWRPLVELARMLSTMVPG